MERNELADEAVCIRCGHRKLASEFIKCARRSSGLSQYCKVCNSERNRIYRNTPEHREKAALYARSKYQANKEYQLQKRKRYPRTCRDPRGVKNSARVQFRRAIEAGLITRPSTCQQCGGGGKIHGHHTDYSRPLDVMWLCKACHAIEHRKYPDVQRNVA